MAKQIFAAEVSHESAPVRIREKLAGNDESVKRVIAKLRSNMDEVFVLSTCNRFVVYAVGENINPIVNYFLEDAETFRYVQFYKNTQASVNHLFATASGLCSQVKGEHQIMTQIKHGHQLAMECGGVGLWLDNVLREAIRIGKKVRTQTGIDKFGASVVDAGFSLLYDKFENIYERNFLVIGTGKIARLALGYLQHEGMQNVIIASHDIERSRDLALQYNVQAITIDKISNYFQEADVIIGGTHHEVSICPSMSGSCTRLETKLATEKKRVILDFGMPRNFDDRLRFHPGISLYNLDDLKALSTSPLDVFGGVEAAWKLVSAETKEFLNIIHQLEMAPILAAYWNRLVNLKDQQLGWLLPKLESASDRDVQLIKRYAHKLIRSISREPLKNLRALAGDTQANATVEVVKNLYDFHHVKLNLSDN
jgi:glutamyl-tRNA reductase